MKASKSRKKKSTSLARYGVAAGAGIAAVVAPASASVIYFDNTHAFTVNQGDSSFNWDIDGDGNIDFTIKAPFSSTIFATRQNAGNAWIKAAGSNKFHLQALNTTLKIGPSLPANRFQTNATVVFLNSSHGATGGLHAGTQDVGFKFEVSGQTDYGWASITLDPGVDASLTVNDWAYDNSGMALLVGATIPEPSDAALGLGLLALGAAGVAAYRKRKLAV